MRQLSLFENQVVDLEPLLKAAMNRAAKRCGLSRQQIVDKMNEVATMSGFKLNANARTLSLEVLEKWLNPAERAYVPGYNAVQAFITVTKDLEPFQVLARGQGCELISGDDLKILQAAKLDREIQALKRKKKRIEAEL